MRHCRRQASAAPSGRGKRSIAAVAETTDKLGVAIKKVNAVDP
jgi:hypothetical protein